MASIEHLSPAPSPEESANAASRRAFLLKDRDARRDGASELQRNVAEAQTAKYESALYVLMERTKDNSDLVNALNAFIDGVNKQAGFGEPDKPLSRDLIDKLTNLFVSVAETLEFDMNNKGAEFNEDARKQWRKEKGFN